MLFRSLQAIQNQPPQQGGGFMYQAVLPVPAAGLPQVPHAQPQRPFVIHDSKSKITPFDGTPSRLNPWIQDLEIFWQSQGANRMQHSAQICASIYMHCADIVKDNMQLVSRILLAKVSYLLLILLFKSNYETRRSPNR